ncbi:hypothetical protein OAX78_00150 [Planctomycetota bacterium]|nr:hypothetical protein [Planctomycetota bacterium]
MTEQKLEQLPGVLGTPPGGESRMVVAIDGPVVDTHWLLRVPANGWESN